MVTRRVSQFSDLCFKAKNTISKDFSFSRSIIGGSAPSTSCIVQLHLQVRYPARPYEITDGVETVLLGFRVDKMTDVERILLPLLPISGDLGTSDQQGRALDLLPELLAKARN